MIMSIYSFCSHIISALLGSGIGIGVSFIVNCSLIEISRNAYFSMYFAVFFLIIGLYILIRSLRNYYTQYQNPDYIQVYQKDFLRFQYILTLGILLITASLFSFTVHTVTFINLYFIMKIPVFSVLGIAITFALGVTIIDIINLAFYFFQPKEDRPPINSSRQIVPIIFICCLMGMLFGTIFGLMDMEDMPLKIIKRVLLKEEYYCIPIGVVCGGLAGLFASLIDNNQGASPPGTVEKGFAPLAQDEEIEV